MSIVGEFIHWIESVRRYSPLTVRNYTRDIHDFLSWSGLALEEFDASHITRERVNCWVVYLFEQRKLTASSVNRAVASLRTLSRWMVERGYAQRNELAQIPQFKTPKRLPTFVPETRMDEVVGRLKEDIESEDFLRLRNALIVLLIYTSGLRLSEVVMSNVEDIAKDCSSIRVMGKGHKMRVQPLVDGIKPVIHRYLSYIPKSTQTPHPLFTSEKGVRITQRTVERVVDKILKESDVQGRTSPHVLRHTFATHLLNQGSDLREIQELLGHESLRATQVYTHTDIEKLKDIYAKAHPREVENQ